MPDTPDLPMSYSTLCISIEIHHPTIPREEIAAYVAGVLRQALPAGILVHDVELKTTMKAS